MKNKTQSLFVAALASCTLIACGGGSSNKGDNLGGLPADVDKQAVNSENLTGLWIGKYDISAQLNEEGISGSERLSSSSIFQITHEDGQYTMADCSGTGSDPRPIIANEDGSILFPGAPNENINEITKNLPAKNDNNTKISITVNESEADLGSLPIKISFSDFEDSEYIDASDVDFPANVKSVSLNAYKIRDDISAPIGSVTFNENSHSIYCMDLTWISASLQDAAGNVKFSSTSTFISYADLNDEFLEFDWKDQLLSASDFSTKSNTSSLASNFTSTFIDADMPAWISRPNTVNFDYMAEGGLTSDTGGSYDIVLDIDILQAAK